MKEIPILFSTPMVQAILEGRKTMTRRLKGLEEINKKPNIRICAGTYHILSNDTFEAVFESKNTGLSVDAKCPYGLPGDVLWVRETMIFNKNSETYWPVADGYVKTSDYEKVVPSIHVPKKHSRIWLQVEKIRVESLQNISEDDAIAEGVEKVGDRFKNYYNPGKTVGQVGFLKAKTSFNSLWNEINGEESWDDDWWVWVVKFKILSTTGNPELPTICKKQNQNLKL